MQQLILIFHVLIAIAVVSLVLVQHGKGADVGASFGGGAANTMFGSMGPASFLMKLTSILGILFFVTSLALVVFASHQAREPFDFMKGSGIPLTSEPTQPVLNLTPPMPEGPLGRAQPSLPVSKN